MDDPVVHDDIRHGHACALRVRSRHRGPPLRRTLRAFRRSSQGQKNGKIICVHLDDPKCDGYESIEDLPDYELREIEWFFEDYQDVMHREVDGGLGSKRARKRIQTCCDIYRDEFPEGWK